MTYLVATAKCHRIAGATAALVAAGILAATVSAATLAAPIDGYRMLRGVLHSPAAAHRSTGYRFRTIDNPADPAFNDLTGINDAGVISGYYGSGSAGHPSKGYTLAPPYKASDYTSQNFPKSAQTQVTAIDNLGNIAGNFVDDKGHWRGFVQWSGTFAKYKQHPLYGLNNDGNTVWTTSGDRTQQTYSRRDRTGLVVPDKVCGSFAVYLLDTAAGKQQELFSAHCSGIGTGINDSNDVVGWEVVECEIFPCPPPGGWAFKGGQSYEVVYPGGSSYSTATYPSGINNSDEIVGTYYDNLGGDHGFVVTDLLKSPKYTTVDDPNGVGTTSINAVNDKGQLVGTYVDSAGNTDGFLATPQ